MARCQCGREAGHLKYQCDTCKALSLLNEATNIIRNMVKVEGMLSQYHEREALAFLNKLDDKRPEATVGPREVL